MTHALRSGNRQARWTHFAAKMARPMLVAMLLMTLAFWAYAFAVAFTRAQGLALERDREADWVRRMMSRLHGQISIP